MPYDLFQHRHNFAVWAAACAAQRGFQGATVGRLRDALEASDVIPYVRDHIHLVIDDESYSERHRHWCKDIVRHLKRAGVPNPTFGRAAKLVAVYLKSMVIIGPAGDSPLACIAHPPIDRLLLQRVANIPDISRQARELFRTTNWTDLGVDEYYHLIQTIKDEVPDTDPFWRLEQHWNVTQEE